MPSVLETAQKELERWQRRERSLVVALEQVGEERTRLDTELDRVDEQVTYYDNLTRDMKKELRRPGISTLLSSLRKP